MLKEYFQDIFKTFKTGDATEPSYYGALKLLFEDLAEKQRKKLQIVPLPKRTEAGNPDFRVWDGKQKIVGYIEAKAPTVEKLDNIERSEQLKRYRETFPNLILTNFFEFRLYRNGELLKKVQTGRSFVLNELGTVPPVENEKEFLALVEQFFAFSTPRTTTAKTLAIELAKRTRFLRDQVIAEELREEKIEGIQTLEGFYKAFKEHLISSLKLEAFSNLFAQTITYGLFAARSRADDEFNRELAYKYIPPTIGILRDVFRFISSSDLPKQMEWIVDDIAEVLAVSDVRKIIENFYKEKKGRDPIVHFYETFLAEYDPAEREKRGVYYTPEPVVNFIARSVHQLLKERFGKEDGFATSSVTVLDPAAGTLTFPAEAIRLAVEESKNKYGEGRTHSLIRDHILKNFYAFELMMAPYAVGHLKMGFVLDEHGYKLADDERFKLYLTNTLDFTKEEADQFPGVFERAIAEESEKALKVKEETPIMVVIGNPPYSGISENKGKWILEQIKEYKQIEGKSLGERNPKWLQDDYVKFFRFAQWKIEQAGAGILGFITNHAWLENPTFRGMRYSLLKTFDEVFILNLHGSTLKRERTSEGERDENVFDIRPGVAITLCVKKQEAESECRVEYSDLWGTRGSKYKWLNEHSVESVEWMPLAPIAPQYFFVPKQEKGRESYEKFWKVTDIFPVNSVGIVTARDKFVIDFNKQPLQVRINAFRDLREDDEFIKEAYHIKDRPTFRWYIREARQKLHDTEDWEKYFTKILYRPFDERWIYHHPAIIERNRDRVMRHMLKPNLALVTCRQHIGDQFSHIFVSNALTESCYISNRTREIGYCMPLYLYNEKEAQQTIFSGQEKLDLQGAQHTLRVEKDKEVNISHELLETLQLAFGTAPAHEQIFNYVYAVLYAPTYRKKYEEFLKTDFPRTPFTKEYRLFERLAELGAKLIDLHLLKPNALGELVAGFHDEGNGRVKKRKYDEEKQRVYINETQYFDGIAPEVWDYYIGGYQVLDKWLKDRKDRVLSSDDLKHYCQVVTALTKTIEIQKKIDKLYPKAEKNLIKTN